MLQRLAEGLDVHRDGWRLCRGRAHVGDEHVRVLCIAGGKAPVVVERADEGHISRVPAAHVYGMGAAHTLLEQSHTWLVPRPAARLLQVRFGFY